MNVVKMIKREEGYSESAYYCSEGYPTIGIGWKLGLKGADLDNYKYMTVSELVAEQVCYERICEISALLVNNIGAYLQLNEPRQAVLISMAYQLGADGLMKFKKMLAAIEAGDFDTAYIEGLDSRWAKQTGNRANRQMRTMQTGTWSEYE